MKEPNSNSFRPDLEGLRGLAVLVVVLFHMGIDVIPGGFIGVDVFFVLSGFFISSQIIGNVQSKSKVGFVDFYARRARRIIPVSAVVIAVTAITAPLFYPPFLLGTIGWDSIASAFNFANIRYAQVAGGYFDANVQTSPLLHFWSLAVEEQFYMVWPALVFFVTYLGLKRFPANWSRTRGFLNVAFAAAFGVSLAFSIYLTAVDRTNAFYLLTTRAWELSLGGVLALNQNVAAKFASGVRHSVAGVGLALIFVSVFFFNSFMAFPGWIALVPVIGAGAVIAFNGSGNWLRWFLESRPMRALGRWSFSIYLWHWPVLTMLASGSTAQPPLRLKIFAMVLVLALAATSYAFIEHPFRTSKRLKESPRRTFAVAGSFMGVAALSGSALVLAWPTTGSNVNVTYLSTNKVQNLVANGLSLREVPAHLNPSLASAKDITQMATMRGMGCMNPIADAPWHTCEFANTHSSTSVWLVGDSHANHWFPAVNAIALKYGLKLTVHAKSGCPLLTQQMVRVVDGSVYTSCTKWTKRVVAAIKAAKPDLVINAGTIAITGFYAKPYADMVAQIAKLTKHELVIGDVPHPYEDIPTCVAKHPKNPPACSFSQYTPGRVNWKYLKDTIAKGATAAGADYVDPASWMCVSGKCPAIAGNILLYRDNSHLTIQGSQLFMAFMEKAVLANLSGH